LASASGTPVSPALPSLGVLRCRQEYPRVRRRMRQCISRANELKRPDQPPVAGAPRRDDVMSRLGVKYLLILVVLTATSQWAAIADRATSGISNVSQGQQPAAPQPTASSTPGQAQGGGAQGIGPAVCGGCLQTLTGHGGPVIAVTVTSDGLRAVSASLDNTIRLWDLSTGRCLCSALAAAHGERPMTIRVLAMLWDGPQCWREQRAIMCRFGIADQFQARRGSGQLTATGRQACLLPCWRWRLCRMPDGPSLV